MEARMGVCSTLMFKLEARDQGVSVFYNWCPHRRHRVYFFVQQQERAFLLSVILHGDVNACPPRLEQFAPYHSLQVRGADTLMRGPYLGSCCRPSFQRMNKLTPISMSGDSTLLL